MMNDESFIMCVVAEQIISPNIGGDGVCGLKMQICL